MTKRHWQVVHHFSINTTRLTKSSKNNRFQDTCEDHRSSSTGFYRVQETPALQKTDFNITNSLFHVRLACTENIKMQLVTPTVIGEKNKNYGILRDVCSNVKTQPIGYQSPIKVPQWPILFQGLSNFNDKLTNTQNKLVLHPLKIYGRNLVLLS